MPQRVNPIKAKLSKERASRGIPKTRLERLEDIAQAVQAVRLATEVTVWSQANKHLDTCMTLCGYYVPNSDLPKEDVSHIAAKLNTWTDEIKKRDRRIEELEQMLMESQK